MKLTTMIVEIVVLHGHDATDEQVERRESSLLRALDNRSSVLTVNRMDQ